MHDDGSRVYLSKIGDVKIVLHRPIQGKIKTLTIRKSATDKWYACFSSEIEPNLLPEEKRAVGVDVGLVHFATLSNAETVDNPRFLRQGEKRVAKAQRKLSKCDKGSPERKKARKSVAHVYEKVTAQRTDFAHKLSRQWVNRFGILCFEKLNTQNMLQNHCLAKSISDASWYQLIQFSSNKAAEAGRKCILVNPRNTSKKCSRCGAMVEKDLSVRVHSCPYCGLVLDRDVNAAINILAIGLDGLDESPRSPSALADGE
jgi:putative transposase